MLATAEMSLFRRRAGILAVLAAFFATTHPCAALRAGEDAAERLEMIRRIVDERGEYDLAENQLRSFVEANRSRPIAADALMLLGYCQDRQRKSQEAAAAYVRVLDEHPAAPAALRVAANLGAADAFFRLGRFQDAIRHYGDAASPDARPEQAEAALFWRGEANYRLANSESGPETKARFAAAAADFAAFVSRFPNSKQLPSAVLNAGFAFFDAGDHLRALEFFQRFVREFPEDRRAEEAGYYVGETLYRLRRLEEARAAFNSLLASHPDGAFAADARSGSAWTDYDSRRVAEAAAGFEEAAKLAGTDRDRSLSFLYDAGCAWREAGEAQKAAADLLEVAKTVEHELNPLALYRLGTLWQEQARAAREKSESAASPADREKYRAMQKKIGADSVQYFRRAIATGKLGDEEIEARSLLGEVLLDAGDQAAAAEEFAGVASRWPKSDRAPWALYHQALAERGRSLDEKSEAEKASRLRLAAEALRKALSHPNAGIRPQAAWALASYLADLGDSEGAREQYRWLASEAVGWAAGRRDAAGKGDPALEARAGEYAADSLFRLGESYYSASDQPRASGFYQEIVNRFKDSPQAAMALLRLGEIAEKRGDVRAALERYAEALAQGLRFDKARAGAAVGFARLRLGALLVREGQRKKDDAEASRRQLQEALRHLAAVVADPPDQLDLSRPRYYLAEAKYSLGLKREAVGDYEASLRIGGREEPAASAAWFGLAWARRDLGDAAGAAEACSRVIDDFPGSPLRPEALFLMADLRRSKGDAAGALEILDRFIGEFPDHQLAAKAELERASALDETGRHAEAAGAFQKFLDGHPEHPDVPSALYQRSRALWNGIQPQAGAAREAEARWRSLTGGLDAAELPEADRPQALAAEKAMRALAGEVTAVEEEILAALRNLTDNYPDYQVADAAWLMIGEILYDRGDHQQALAAYRKALELAGRNNSALADKAQYRLAWSIQRLAEEAERSSLSNPEPAGREAARKDMWDKRVAAIDAFETIIGRYPQSELVGDACFRAAELRRRSGQDNADPARRSAWFQSALQRYRQSLERSAANASHRRAAEYGEGLCLLLDSHPAEAREIFRKLLLNPDGPYVQESYWGLGQASLDLGAQADAASAFAQALALDRTSEAAAKSRYGLGLAAILAGDRDKARLEFLATETEYPNYPEWAAAALIRAARAALDDGLRDKAISDLERVLARYPDTPAAAEARNLQAGISRRD
ncbi:MAG: tetratricopeptide repeat protein [Planctomycetota bacterium]|jgi:TolA-binding protein|nr:tetratricopeptide repeat protein [Planctomycetota bacterium]